MKTKILALMLLAGSAAFAGPRFHVFVGGGYRGFYGPRPGIAFLAPPVYAPAYQPYYEPAYPQYYGPAYAPYYGPSVGVGLAFGGGYRGGGYESGHWGGGRYYGGHAYHGQWHR
jgi:hypothetical protein